MAQDDRWNILREAIAIVDASSEGFELAGDEVAFSHLASGLLEALAVQFAVRDSALTDVASAAIVTALQDAALAFASRADKASTTHSCDCYHDDIHDFGGCRHVDPDTGDFCECAGVTGRVEREDAAAVDQRVRDAYAERNRGRVDDLFPIV